ncbi:MAG: hypothetical protein QXE31_00010 [Candidatus Woesearchaeota archaeon]
MKKFDYFIENRIVKKQKPDISRANYLIEESEKSYNLLLKKIEKIGIDDESANDFIKTCYDLIMELVRAKMLIDGYNASGHGAHEAEVSYSEKLGLSETEINFLDQLRNFRNGILYYGSNLKKEYAEKVIDFTKKIYSKIKSNN